VKKYSYASKSLQHQQPFKYKNQIKIKLIEILEKIKPVLQKDIV